SAREERFAAKLQPFEQPPIDNVTRRFGVRYVRHVRHTVAKADDAQTGGDELEIRGVANAVGEIPREGDVRVDRGAMTGEPELLHRHPDLQRAKGPRLLEAVL